MADVRRYGFRQDMQTTLDLDLDLELRMVFDGEALAGGGGRPSLRGCIRKHVCTGR